MSSSSPLPSPFVWAAFGELRFFAPSILGGILIFAGFVGVTAGGTLGFLDFAGAMVGRCSGYRLLTWKSGFR